MADPAGYRCSSIFSTARRWPPVPPRLRTFGSKMIGPVLMRSGSEAQKARYLPPVVKGTEYWFQGFSEPGAASDLASLNTKAVRTDDGYIVNKQKTWTTTAKLPTGCLPSSARTCTPSARKPAFPWCSSICVRRASR